jgi:hypothetical protein
VITACADANNVMHLSTTGSCDPAVYPTTIQWNQQGPQGPQGPQGLQGAQGQIGPQGPPGSASQGIIAATLPQTFTGGFHVYTAIAGQGTYLVQGSVTERINTAGWTGPKKNIYCIMQWGKQDNELRQSFQYFSPQSDGTFAPPSYKGPASISAIDTSPSYGVSYLCNLISHNHVKPLPTFINPTITVTPVREATLLTRPVVRLH